MYNLSIHIPSNMSYLLKNLLLVGLVVLHAQPNYGLEPKSDHPRVARAPSLGEKCECPNIVVSSTEDAQELHPNTLEPFQLSDSHFNAFKSTVYRNSKSLTLIGGKGQSWRIHGGSRAGRILIRNKSCKEICPFDCPSDWEVYRKPGYVNDKSIELKCQSGDVDGSADGKLEG